jgi:hypothetical protein
VADSAAPATVCHRPWPALTDINRAADDEAHATDKPESKASAAPALPKKKKTLLVAKTAGPAASADGDNTVETADKPAPTVPKPKRALVAVAKKEAAASAKATAVGGGDAPAKAPRGKTAFMHYMAAVRQQIKGEHQLRITM